MNLIDCDVHLRWSSKEEFGQYLPEPWRTFLHMGRLVYPTNGYSSPVGVRRRDAIPPSGKSPGSDPQFVVEDLVDRYDLDYAILMGESGHLGISNLTNPDWAAALATAYNEWLINDWLSVDERFLGSMFIAHQDPTLAAKEIERIGDHPRIVQIVMGTGAQLAYGNRFYNPIYEAASRHNLPIAIHVGTEGAGTASPPTAIGYPTLYLEWHTLLMQSMQAHLVSLLCEGTFERFPKLRYVFVEGGITWLPGLMWRLDKNWKALRREVPWVTRRPSEYLEEHVRLTTQPLEEPEDPKDMVRFLELYPSDKLLMFSSDYPHWDFDNPRAVLSHLPERLQKRIAYENAQEFYNLKPRQAAKPRQQKNGATVSSGVSNETN